MGKGIKQVAGAVDQNRLSIRSVEGGVCICYDNVPLWRTATLELSDLDIFLYDPVDYRTAEDDTESYALFCIDGWGDIYTYGLWRTEEQAREWLANPVSLY